MSILCKNHDLFETHNCLGWALSYKLQINFTRMLRRRLSQCTHRCQWAAKSKHQGSNYQSVNCNLPIKFVFSWITLTSFCEIHESTLSFCWNFCLQGNQKVSVYTSSSTNRLYLTPESIKLYTIFLQLDSILAPNLQ